MAWTSASVWEIRPDGSSNNGGGFDPTFGGTDYSQQTSPQLTVTDAAGTNTTTITSATGGFTPAMVGNGVNVVTVGVFQITAVPSATSLTVDRATGTFSGKTANVGGAMSCTTAGFDPIGTVAVAGNKLWVRATNAAGTVTSYTPSTVQVSTGTVGVKDNPVSFEGYGTTRGDGVRAQINQASALSMLVNGYAVMKNFKFFGGAGIDAGLHVTGNQFYGENLWALVSGDSYVLNNAGNNNTFVNCLLDGNNASTNNAVISATGGGGTYLYCVVKNAKQQPGVIINGGLGNYFHGCIVWKNGNGGIKVNGGTANAQFRKCVFWGNTGDGALIGGAANGLTAWVFKDCIFGANTLYDIEYNLADVSTGNPGAAEFMAKAWSCNFFYTTGTARYHWLPANSSDTTLTADPFVDSTNGNFTLNTTTGGGAVVIANPCPLSFVDGLNSATHYAGVADQAPSNSNTVTMRSLWRELTNERNTTVIPDSTVDIYLQWGLEELNRRLHYHYTTASDVTLQVGVQEYPMPVDAIEIVWVQYGSNRLLEKGSVEQWRRLNEDWRNELQGEPLAWAHYGNQFVIRPKPSALAVAAAPNLTVRRKDTPPSITTNGPEQLPTEAYRVVVLYGAYLWSGAYPDSVVAQNRAQMLKAEFETAVQAMIESYGRREVSL